MGAKHTQKYKFAQVQSGETKTVWLAKGKYLLYYSYILYFILYNTLLGLKCLNKVLQIRLLKVWILLIPTR